MSTEVLRQITENYNKTSWFHLRKKIRFLRGKRYWTSRYKRIPDKWFIQFHKWNRERKPYYNCEPRESWYGKPDMTHSFSCDRKHGYKMGVTVPYYGGVPFKFGRYRTNLFFINKLKDRIKNKFGWAIPHAHADMWVCTRCGLKVYMSAGDMHYDWDKRKPVGCKITHSKLVGKYAVNSGMF